MSVDPAVIIENTILRGVVGSSSHGLALAGTDDRDEMGVCIEPLSYAMGLSAFEQYIYRSAAVREQMHNARSQPGDLDLVIYSLRKFVKLLLKGNPTILGLLFLPEYITKNEVGQKLVDIRSEFVTMRSAKAFLGYLTAQKQRLIGERGGKHGVRHIGATGYDTKYAMHMLRLGMQGEELLSTGGLKLPMRGPDRDFLMQIRNGDVPLDDVMIKADQLVYKMEKLIHLGWLRDHPDEQKVEEWLVSTYTRAWREDS